MPLRVVTQLWLRAVHPLDLSYNNIDDKGVGVLVGALINSRIQHLYLSYNLISARGCQGLAALLSNPYSNLEKLDIQQNNNVDDEGAIIFANALTTNRKLKKLVLWSTGITVEGWGAFSRVLCDTSSINKTFLSNHTLESLDAVTWPRTADVRSMLALNSSTEDKKNAAIKKILKHHRHFDMQPLFEWDLKVLPLAFNWFERARSFCLEEYGRRQDAILDLRKREKEFAILDLLAGTYESDYERKQELRRRRGAVRDLFGGDYDEEEVVEAGFDWLERARSIENTDQARIAKRKLDAIYQFIRAMPEVFEPAPAV